MEIALIQDDLDKQSKEHTSLSQLKQVIQNLKTANLPKFQTEFHQLCQFDDDPKILKDQDKRIYDEKNGLGRCCLHESCIRGNSKLLKSLLANVKNINEEDINGFSAAHVAAKFGQLECLQILYENDIDLGKVDKNGKTLCHLAAEFNHPNIIQFCSDIGISLEIKCNSGKTPLHYASEFGSLEALKVIALIDISLADNNGNTAAHLAVQNDRLNCLKYLVRLGLPVNIIKNKMGRNVSHEACFYGANNCLHWMFENDLVEINFLDSN